MKGIIRTFAIAASLALGVVAVPQAPAAAQPFCPPGFDCGGYYGPRSYYVPRYYDDYRPRRYERRYRRYEPRYGGGRGCPPGYDWVRGQGCRSNFR